MLMSVRLSLHRFKIVVLWLRVKKWRPEGASQRLHLPAVKFSLNLQEIGKGVLNRCWKKICINKFKNVQVGFWFIQLDCLQGITERLKDCRWTSFVIFFCYLSILGLVTKSKSEGWACSMTPPGWEGKTPGNLSSIFPFKDVTPSFPHLFVSRWRENIMHDRFFFSFFKTINT